MKKPCAKRVTTSRDTVLRFLPHILLRIVSFYQNPEHGWTRPRFGEPNTIRTCRNWSVHDSWLLNRFPTIRLINRAFSNLFPADVSLFLTYGNMERTHKNGPPGHMVERTTGLIADEFSLLNTKASLITENIHFMKIEMSTNRLTNHSIDFWTRAICTLPTRFAHLRELCVTADITMKVSMYYDVARLPHLTHLVIPPCEVDPITEEGDNGMGILVKHLPHLVFLEFTFLIRPLIIPSPGLPRLERLVLNDIFSVGIEHIGRRLPLLKQITIECTLAFERQIEPLCGILTMPQHSNVFIDLPSIDFDHREPYSEASLNQLCKILRHTESTIDIESTFLSTTRGMFTRSDEMVLMMLLSDKMLQQYRHHLHLT